jgi:UDP-2-acetamido-2,6-beta-L-arabino-hexul-4-ose reductase
MSKFTLTGGHGFIGWHTRAALRERGLNPVLIPVGDVFDAAEAQRVIEGTERLIHIAGVNRAKDDEVLEGNLRFAAQIVGVIRRSSNPPKVIVYANSTQAGNGTVYGAAKEEAATMLAEVSEAVGAQFVDARLPNLFGEHGRPFYNAVTSTFAHLLAHGEQPSVREDKELTLLHAQNAADILVGNVDIVRQSALEARVSVSELLSRLVRFADTYRRGEIPDVSKAFDRDLFNTYRSFAFSAQTPIPLTRHVDARGSFFEIIRSHGGPGQSSFSTTAPGITRGNHFHRRKIERFTVLSGKAVISLRRLFDNEVVTYDVDGDNPVAVDIPTMWSHSITNTGIGLLYTSFWTNDIFDPSRPDTTGERV